MPKQSSPPLLSLAFALHESAVYLHGKKGQQQAVHYLLRAAADHALAEVLGNGTGAATWAGLPASMQMALPLQSQLRQAPVKRAELENMIMLVARLLAAADAFFTPYCDHGPVEG